MFWFSSSSTAVLWTLIFFPKFPWSQGQTDLVSIICYQKHPHIYTSYKNTNLIPAHSHCSGLYTTLGSAIHIDVIMNGPFWSCAVPNLHSCKRVPCICFSFQLFFSCLTSMLYNWVNSNYFYYPDRPWYDLVFLWSLSSHCKCRLFVACSSDKVLHPLILFSDITSTVKLFLSHHFPAPHPRHLW